MNPIHVEPIEFNWRTEWLPRARMRIWHGCTKVSDIVEAITKWTQETDAWLRGLDPKKQRDIISILEAENGLLWWYIDNQKLHWARFDFRQRWFDAILLARAVERAQLENAAKVIEMYRRLEVEAEKIGWLP